MKGQYSYKVVLLEREGDDAANFVKMLATVGSSGLDGKIGRVEAGNVASPFIVAWRERIASTGMQVVDASRGVDAAFSLKSKTELVRG